MSRKLQLALTISLADKNREYDNRIGWHYKFDSKSNTLCF
jgi:hypothetical protein